MNLGQELVVCIEHLLCLVKFSVLYRTFCMFGKFAVHGLYQCIEGKIILACQKDVKMRLALNAP